MNYHSFPALYCEAAPIPANGQVMYDSPNQSPTFNSKVTYSCDMGFELSGEATHQCTALGNWSGSTPICNGKDFGRKYSCPLERL